MLIEIFRNIVYNYKQETVQTISKAVKVPDSLICYCFDLSVQNNFLEVM